MLRHDRSVLLESLGFIFRKKRKMREKNSTELILKEYADEEDTVELEPQWASKVSVHA